MLLTLYEGFLITRKAIKAASDKAISDFAIQVLKSISNLEMIDEEFPLGLSHMRPINWAIASNWQVGAEILISRGVNVDQKCSGMGLTDRQTRTAVEMACIVGCSKQIFTGLLERSERLQELDYEGNSLAHLLCMRNVPQSLELLEVLCEFGFDFDATTAQYHKTPLMWAVHAENQDHVRFFLKHQVDLDVRDSLEWNVLHLAAFRKKQDLTQLIIEHGHSRINNIINSPNNHGLTPLHIAAEFGEGCMLDALIQEGANIEAEDRSRRKAVHIAAMKGNMEALEVLLKHKCTQTEDNSGMTPELYALLSGHTAIVERLREHNQRMLLPFLLPILRFRCQKRKEKRELELYPCNSQLHT